MKKQIGKIVNTHGIRGDVRVLSNSDFKDIRFKVGNKLEISGRNHQLTIEIEKWSQHKNFDILKFVGFDNINDVEKFKNCLLLGEPLTNDALGSGEYFLDDIIGLTAIDDQGNELGQIIDINLQSAQPLLLIKKDKTSMIPYVDEFVKAIDLEKGQMVIKLIPGLINED